MGYEDLLKVQQDTFRRATAPRPRVFALNSRGANPVELAEVLDISFDVILNDVGKVKVELPLNSVNAALFADAHPDASIPLVIQVGALETVWFVTHVDENISWGEDSITLNGVSPERHLQSLYGWPNPRLLPEFQISKIKLAAGPVARLIKEQLLAPNFKRMAKKTKGRVHYVAPTKPEDNYTRTTIIGVQMNEVLELVRSLIDTDGLTLSYEAYLPGRGQTPPPGHDPNRMALVWDIQQRAELPPGGLLWEGIIKSVTDFWKDTWDTLTGFTDYDAENKAVDYWGKPQFMLRRNQYRDVHITTVKPTGSTYTVGGKSQDWFNDLLSSGLKAIFMMAPPPFNILLNLSGLDDIFDDRLMAYHSFDDWSRRERMGPLGFFETFSPSIGLSLDAVMLMRQAQYKTRATRSHEVALGGAMPFESAALLKVGSMIALELPRDRYAVSFVTEIHYDWSTANDSQLEFQISDRPRRDPQESVLKTLQGLATLINKATLTE
ncbi:hypothetical protein KPA07_06345 [Corynebacterium aurimucosum]|uniref:Gp37-like protein n=1 Tax=Corynebacterium aurimucosum TaxID=169292 RepID=UPI001C0E97A9|nr:hypothetical protein [Corynebacterium aurimucosum]MBU5654532.1 hypothetical protein [Corynebacterium aurimucosum]